MTHHEAWVLEQVDEANAEPPLSEAYAVWHTLLRATPPRVSARDAREALRAIAIQMNWNRGTERALENKRRHLRSSPFPPAVCAAVEKHWKQARQSTGLGRFDRFNRTWTQISGHRVLLGLLQRLVDPATSDAQALRLVEDYAANDDNPFKPAARFSECLHLSRPHQFPVVNAEQQDIATVLVWGDQRPDLTRTDYLEMRERLLAVPAALKLRDTVALDFLLLAADWHFTKLCILDDETGDESSEAIDFLRTLRAMAKIGG